MHVSKERKVKNAFGYLSFVQISNKRVRVSVHILNNQPMGGPNANGIIQQRKKWPQVICTNDTVCVQQKKKKKAGRDLKSFH